MNVLLLAALLVSSLYLVRVSYESRRLFAALDQLQGEERALDSQRERLTTDLRSQATPLRVERAARERLAMRAATPGVTHYVALPRAASGASSSPPSVASAALAAPTGASR